MAKVINRFLIYQELIKATLIENNVKKMVFKGDDNFAKKYSHVEVLLVGDTYSLRVYLRKDDCAPFLNFYFDFTVDYANLLSMIETDLFNVSHFAPTLNIDFEFNENDNKTI